MLDVAIIGGGPAGLSAGIEAKRLGLRFAIIEASKLGGQIRSAWKVTDYPGFPGGIRGAELADLFIAHLGECEIVYESVEEIEKTEDGFRLRLGLRYIESRCVIIAIGQVPKKLGLGFEEELADKQVWYYPEPQKVPCEGKNILVVGGGDSAFDEAISFAEMGANVGIAMRGSNARANKKLLGIAKAKGIEIAYNKNIVQFANGNFDHLIVCIGKEQDKKIIKNLGANMEGCFFAGDFSRGRDRHVAIAVGDGLKATLSAAEYVGRK